MPRSRSPSRSRSISKSRPPAREVSRSRSRSPRRKVSHSRSISRSRSPKKEDDPSSPTKKGPAGKGSKGEEPICPFLIRLFVTKGKHTPMMEFDQGKLPIQDEFQLYGWKDSTPSSLLQLLLPSLPPNYRSHLARYSFRHIYVDASPRGLYRHKDLTSFTGRDLMNLALSKSSIETNGTNQGNQIDGEDGEGVEGGKKDKMDMELDEIPTTSANVNRHERSGGSGGGGRKIEEKTLDEYGFVTGDLISVSLYIPEPRGLKRPIPGVTAGTGDEIGAGEGVRILGASINGGGGMSGVPSVGHQGGQGRDFGWQNADNSRRPNGPNGFNGQNGISEADKSGPWERGAPLPPQSNIKPLGRYSASGPSGPTGPSSGPNDRGDRGDGGRWGRGGGQMGRNEIRPNVREDGPEKRDRRDSRRDRSPDYKSGERPSRRSLSRSRDRSRSRSKSPDRRRESWNKRR